MKKTVLLIPLVLIIINTFLLPCTVGVASGKATADGRPLLWKNRDSSGFENYVRYFISNGYSYLGLFSRGIPSSMYGGMNERGFAIMNSVAYDLGKTGGFDNGRLMKKALEECATIEEFESLLKRLLGKYDLAANFGVIDSHGGAAIFETSSNNYKKFDANKSPKGYLLRTNFSFSGGGSVGIKRFKREKEIFEKELKGKLDVNFLLKNVFRDIKDKDGTIFDYKKGFKRGDKRFYYTKDSICRPYSVSSMVFRGVKPDEPEYLSTFYIILGNPLTGSAIPLWVKAGNVPGLVENYKHSPLNFEQMKIYSYIYPHDKAYTLDVSYLAGENSPNLLRKIFTLEDSILKETESALENWGKSFPGKKTIALFQKYIANKAYKNYKKINKEFFYFNMSKRMKFTPYIKIKERIKSNFLALKKNRIIFTTEKGKIILLDLKTKKKENKKIHLKLKNKRVLLAKGLNNKIYLYNKAKLNILNGKTFKIEKTYNLSNFKGFKKYLNKAELSFLVRVRNNLYAGVFSKHIIINIDLRKKRIQKKAGKNNKAGFRDGTGLLSLVSNPLKALRNYRDELVFLDADNFSIRSLTPSGVVFTLAGINGRGRDNGWAEEVKIKNPYDITLNKNDEILILSENGLRIIDNDKFSYILKKWTGRNFIFVPSRGNIFLYNKKDKMIWKILM